MSNLDKLRAKIAALLAKTTAAGCTEAEALAAAEMAARLMAEHGLSGDDIAMTADRATEKTVRATWRTYVAGAVAEVTNTAAVYLLSKEAWEFLGCAPGPQVAAYLYKVLVGAVERESAVFRKSTIYLKRRTLKTRRAAVADFQQAMVARLRLRLRKLFEATQDLDAQAAARRALTNRYSNCAEHTYEGKKKPFDRTAAAAGWSAAGDVTLVHGVAGADGRPMAIEGGR